MEILRMEILGAKMLPSATGLGAKGADGSVSFGHRSGPGRGRAVDAAQALLAAPLAPGAPALAGRGGACVIRPCLGWQGRRLRHPPLPWLAGAAPRQAPRAGRS